MEKRLKELEKKVDNKADKEELVELSDKVELKQLSK